MPMIHKGTRCPCWDGSREGYSDKCLHPYAVVWQKRMPRFKDDEQDHTLHPFCPFMEYRGPTGYVFGSMTKEEWDKHVEHWTLCLHPDEYVDSESFREVKDE